MVDSMAVQFCARKVAAVHGDLRKALDICRCGQPTVWWKVLMAFLHNRAAESHEILSECSHQ